MSERGGGGPSLVAFKYNTEDFAPFADVVDDEVHVHSQKYYDSNWERKKKNKYHPPSARFE